MDEGIRWSELGRSDLKQAGLELVVSRLTSIGCATEPDTDRRRTRLAVAGKTTKTSLLVSTQRVGGYAFWAKRSIDPRPDLYAVVVLVDADRTALFAVPSIDWLAPATPLTSRDYETGTSEPEYGIELSAGVLARLSRYRWTSHFDALLAR